LTAAELLDALGVIAPLARGQPDCHLPHDLLVCRDIAVGAFCCRVELLSCSLFVGIGWDDEQCEVTTLPDEDDTVRLVGADAMQLEGVAGDLEVRRGRRPRTEVVAHQIDLAQPVGQPGNQSGQLGGQLCRPRPPGPIEARRRVGPKRHPRVALRIGERRADWRIICDRRIPFSRCGLLPAFPGDPASVGSVIARRIELFSHNDLDRLA